SKEQNEDSVKESGAEVQKGNPPVERNIQRLFRRAEVTKLIKRCNDFGAGGVSVAIGELADGLEINLDAVPKKYDGLDGTELAISESQERMAVVIEAKDKEKFLAYAQGENLEATVVAKVTDNNRIKMFWNNQNILDLDREFLDTNGAPQDIEIAISKDSTPVLSDKTSSSDSTPVLSDEASSMDSTPVLSQRYLKILRDLNVASQKGLIDRFDSTIGTGTVLMPLGGKNQLTAAMGMAAKIPVLEGDSRTASLMSFGFDPDLSEKNCYLGAMYAVIDSVTKLVAMGGEFENINLSFQEYFEKLGKDPVKWGKPFAALLAALKVQRELKMPAIGGKDSMSGTFNHISVPPTLISFAVTTADVENVISPEFKKTDSKIVLINPRKKDNGELNFASYIAAMKFVEKAIKEKKILSASNIEKGGIFAAVSKMSLGNSIGAIINTDIIEGVWQRNNISNENNLYENYETSNSSFAPNYGALLVEGDEDLSEMVLENIENENIDFDCVMVGKTIENEHLEIRNTKGNLEIDLKVVYQNWSKPLEEIFPTEIIKYDEMNKDETVKNEEVLEKDMTFDSENDNIYVVKKESETVNIVNIRNENKVKAKVLIPCFPGTNCEVDSKRAFDLAGGNTEILLLRNLTPKALEESIVKLAEEIKKSQIIMLPGGFSGGDEPDGSAKYIAAIFRNEKVREALDLFLNEKDGLMLGICNGF
ncbi:MAG: phosphoribosylformylglycinamidine synthase subunit PurQ, partial [Anaerovoracaceae bacterium]